MLHVFGLLKKKELLWERKLHKTTHPPARVLHGSLSTCKYVACDYHVHLSKAFVRSAKKGTHPSDAALEKLWL